jgi:hypothetical protein
METLSQLILSEVRKTPFYCRFYIKTFILPSQARDKNREATQKRDDAFIAGRLTATPHRRPSARIQHHERPLGDQGRAALPVATYSGEHSI